MLAITVALVATREPVQSPPTSDSSVQPIIVAQVIVVTPSFVSTAVSAIKPTAKPDTRLGTPDLVTPTSFAKPRILTATTAVTPLPTVRPLPASAHIAGLKYERQLFNNCGPATLSMLLNAIGVPMDQTQAMNMLRPVNGPTGDRNVNPDELQAFAESKNVKTRLFVGGTISDLKLAVALGVPVMVESWYVPFPNDEMGHYQLLVGYEGDNLIFYDSFHGPNISLKINEFDALWRVFNRKYIAAWTDQQPVEFRALMAGNTDTTAMYHHALDTARGELSINPQDKWAWWNIGTNLLAVGEPMEASHAFDAARKIGLPWRTLWYQFGPYEAYFAANRYDDVIALANETLTRVGNLEESYYWRGRAQAAKGNSDLARKDFRMALALNPNYAAAKLESR